MTTRERTSSCAILSNKSAVFKRPGNDRGKVPGVHDILASSHGFMQRHTPELHQRKGGKWDERSFPRSKKYQREMFTQVILIIRSSSVPHRGSIDISLSGRSQACAPLRSALPIRDGRREQRSGEDLTRAMPWPITAITGTCEP